MSRGRLADGSIRSFKEAVELLGVSQSRASQILRLLNLSPAIQEAVLMGESGATESRLRRVAEEVEWGRQGLV